MDTSSQDIVIDSYAELARRSVEFAREARIYLEILSRDLDPRVYDNEEFIEAVKRLTLGSPRAKVRIIVIEPRILIAHGHRLLDLAMRLSSFIEIRAPAPEFEDCSEAFLLVDRRGFIHRRQADRYEALANADAPSRTGHLLNRFEEIWQSATPDINFRRLML